ncbi:hypothetical protein [Azospirillum sp. SYSU D00513]|uniref:hypothetical protein n=1 Tax=Azospirillum sp. SYSU D00513 TaxID=2812561 RepID=UPI001A96660E|nr:hypothetical protein [Azospirillum sp. SYSU D00513]
MKVNFVFVRRLEGNEKPLSEEAIAEALRDEGWSVRAIEEESVESVENHDGSMDDYHRCLATFADRNEAIRFQKSLRGDSFFA